MKLLAFDTSSLACTVGVLHDGNVTLKHAEEAREHTRLLMPMIREAMAEAGLALADLDAVVVGNGPGSFIGLRIAASVAQGLAWGTGLRIVPVSSLAAVALAAGEAGQAVCVTQDAHMNEVYCGLFRVEPGRRVSALSGERLQSQTAIEELAEISGDCIAAGYGWQRYPALLELNRGRLSDVSECHYPHAAELLDLGAAAWEAGASVAPEDLNPAYLRQQVAKKPKAGLP